MSSNMIKGNGMSRRDALGRGATLAALTGVQMVTPNRLLAQTPPTTAIKVPRGDTLVLISLRGGADGLNLVVPYGDPDYAKLRPTIGFARPDDTTADSTMRTLDLDGFFGLHPAMAPLLPIFKAGGMIALHAAGSPDPTRSHFDAIDAMERGTPSSHSIRSGWLGRHLDTADTGNNSPLRGVGWGASLQVSLLGADSASAIQSLINFKLASRTNTAPAMLSTLTALYQNDPLLQSQNDQTQGVMNMVAKLDIPHYSPANGAQYAQKSGFNAALMQTAALIKAEAGLEATAIDIGGWDTHNMELPEIEKDLTELSAGLSAFYTDLGPLMSNVTVVVMSEFGRRAHENASKGTDHGHGNIMFVMSGHIAAKKPVIANWPTLAADKLDNGDLAATIDYRDVLTEVLTRRLNSQAIDQIFPGFTPATTPLGIVAANS